MSTVAAGLRKGGSRVGDGRTEYASRAVAFSVRCGAHKHARDASDGYDVRPMRRDSRGGESERVKEGRGG